MSSSYDVRNLRLAKKGMKHIEWALRGMPVVGLIRKRFSEEKPLRGIHISGCLHITAETANLALCLRDGGAEISLCASNPMSTQDEIAAALVADCGISVFAVRGENQKTYYEHIHSNLNQRPHITLDDGADLVTALHRERQELLPQIIGGTEETTTGVTRLRALAKDGRLAYPIIAINDADTKHLFDNRYGTGQSTLDGITRATNILWAGKTVVVAGYGWCGRGVAMRARGFGANVVVAEVDPIKALEAIMDGYRVMPMLDAAKIGDVFITLTGGTGVIDRQHFDAMKDGAILANSGHFNVEINVTSLEAAKKEKRCIRSGVDEYLLRDGRRIYLLAGGRLINLAAAEGHPADVMDMSFANQALCVEYLVTRKQRLPLAVHSVPKEIDEEVARLKLASMGITIDVLTKEQERYLTNWESGT